MNTASKPSRVVSAFLTVSIISGLIGFSDLGPPYVHGLGRALGAVFFILYLIFNLLKNERMDGETPSGAVQSSSGVARSKPAREIAGRH